MICGVAVLLAWSWRLFLVPPAGSSAAPVCKVLEDAAPEDPGCPGPAEFLPGDGPPPAPAIERKDPPSPYQNGISDAGFVYTNQLCIAGKHCGQIPGLGRGVCV